MDRLDQTILVDYAAHILARLKTVHKIDFAKLGERKQEYVTAALVTAWHESRAPHAEICADLANELNHGRW